MVRAPYNLIIVLLIVALVAMGCRGCSDGVDSPGKLEHGSQPREHSPRVDGEHRLAHQRGAIHFGFDLLGALAPEGDENLVLSPSVAAEGLGRIAAAAEESEAARWETFYFLAPLDGVHRRFNELDIRLAAHAQEARFHFDHRAAVVVDGRLEVGHRFLNLLSHHYGDGIHRLDLRGNPKDSHQAIQRWVDAHSGPVRGPRFDEFSPDDTDLILASAASLQASWAFGFASEETEYRPFTTADGQVLEVPMMVGRESYRLFDDGQSRGAAILFDGGNLSFIAVQPASQEQDFRAWREGFDGEAFTALVEGLSGLVDGEVQLPRLSMASSLELTRPLQELDFPALDASDPVNLSGMLASASDQELFLSKVVHGASLQVGERGVGQSPRQPSGSAIDLPTGPPEGDQEAMIFDRPFVAVIYDTGTNTILMLGIVHDPS